MKIGIDIDGVLADFTGHWPALYKLWFGRDVDQRIVDSWNGIAQVFGDEDLFWRWVDSVPNFWRDMPLIEGAAGALYDLKMKGHELILITNRHDRARAQTDQWAKLHLPVFPRLWEIHHVKGDKSVVPCQLYIDDNPRRIRELRKNQHRVIRFWQPWNEELDSSGDSDWVAGSWVEVLDIIEMGTHGREIPGQTTVYDHAGTIKVPA